MIEIGVIRISLAFLLLAEQGVLALLTRRRRKRKRMQSRGHDMLLALWVVYIALLLLIAQLPNVRLKVNNAAGLVLLALGILFRTWPLHSIGDSYAPAITIYEHQQLVQNGAYARFAHPLYAGLALELIGLAVITASPVGYMFAVLGIAVTRVQVAREERLLTATYGDEYTGYRKRVWDFGDHYRRMR